jgi:prevent-host-death family protein
MKKISIQDLKAQLSAAIAEAESGETILITRHNEPVALLAPAHLPFTSTVDDCLEKAESSRLSRKEPVAAI